MPPSAELAPSPTQLAPPVEASLFTTPEDSLAQQMLGIEGVREPNPDAVDVGSAMLIGNVVVSSVPEWAKDSNGNNQLPKADIITTLPPEFFGTDEKGNIFMPATSLDLLEPGVYSLKVTGSSAIIEIFIIDGHKYAKSTSSRNEKGPLFTGVNPEEQINKRVLPQSFGTFSFAEAFATQLSGKDSPKSPVFKILEKSGFRYDLESGGRTIPTPNTVKELALVSGFPIEIVTETNETGTIPLKGYLGSFARGRYPVGSGDLAVYAHDVRSNDHMGGVAILGSEGLSMLGPIAESALLETSNATETDLNELASFFDGATSILSQIIERPNSTFYKELLGTEANNAGAAEELLKLCQSAKTNADKFAVDLDGSKLFDYLKGRLTALHAEHGFGEDFDGFLKTLASVEFTEAEKPVENPTEHATESIFE